MPGGRYLAIERGAFKEEEDRGVSPKPKLGFGINPATAPLYEFAAVHDGQPADLWLLTFYRWYGDLN